MHQGRAADHGPGQIDQVEARAREVDVVEPGAGQVDVLEAGAGQVLAGEVGHPASLAGTRSADELLGEPGGHRLAVAPDDGAIHDDQAHPGSPARAGASWLARAVDSPGPITQMSAARPGASRPRSRSP